jgi:hypothetical protein
MHVCTAVVQQLQQQHMISTAQTKHTALAVPYYSALDILTTLQLSQDARIAASKHLYIKILTLHLAACQIERVCP